jgi:hypothetical protein
MPPDSVYALRSVTKLAAEVLPLAVDFTAILADTETLSGTPTVAVDPVGLTAGSPAVLAAAYQPLANGDAIAIGKGISCQLSGGTSGSRYTLTVTCSTSVSGRVAGGKVLVLIDA